MDLTNLAMQSVMRQTGITPHDMENVRTLITALNELPDRLTAIEKQLERIESKIGD